MKVLGPFDQYLIHEFVEDYRDGLMSRRDMIRRVIYITGGVASAATVLTSMGITPMTRAALATETLALYQETPQSPLSVAADDPRVNAESLEIPATDGSMIMAYRVVPVDSATPTAAEGLPLVMICHENRGLTEHILDVTRRWAVAGYAAVALDLLSREGGTDAIEDPAAIPGLFSEIDPSRHVGDFMDTAAYFQDVDGIDGSRVGMTGFCFGGGITWRVATAMPDLNAAAPYYGPPPELEEVPNISAAVLGVYSDDPDDFANNGREDLEQALIAAGTTFQFNIYPDTQHAFNNDTGGRWNEEASLQAWNDTLAWFGEYV